MEINNTGGTALFALQQALRQPQNIVDLMAKSVVDTSQSLAAPTDKAEIQKTVSGQSSKGSTINIVA